MQHLEAPALDLPQQGAIDAGHHEPGPLRASVRLGQQRKRLLVQGLGAVRLEAHQGGEALAVAPRRLPVQQLLGLDVETLQLVQRQVDPTAPGVVANVANDVGQLHRKTQAVRIGDGAVVGPTEDVAGDLADDAGHQVAVLAKAREIEES